MGWGSGCCLKKHRNLKIYKTRADGAHNPLPAACEQMRTWGSGATASTGPVPRQHFFHVFAWNILFPSSRAGERAEICILIGIPGKASGP